MTEKVLEQVTHLFASIDERLNVDDVEINVCEHVEARVGSVINALLFGYGFEGVSDAR